MTIIITAVADSFGRKTYANCRRAADGARRLGVCRQRQSDSPDALAAIFGTISPSGKEVGPFLSLEQADLAAGHQRSEPHRGFRGVQSGWLVRRRAGRIDGQPALAFFPSLAIAGYKFLIWGYVASALLLAGLFTLLSPDVEAAKKNRYPTPRKVGLEKSRGIVIKLAGLFALDAFAGAFIVQSIVAYWFFLRYQTDLTALGGIFFGTNIFAPGPVLSRRAPGDRPPNRSLLNTMVFTHLPSNLLILLVPMMPNVEWAYRGFTATFCTRSRKWMCRRASLTQWPSSTPTSGQRRLRFSHLGAQRRRCGCAVIHRRDSRGSSARFAVLAGGRHQDCLRPVDFRRCSAM